MSVNARVASTRAALKVLEQGRSLNDVLTGSPPLERELAYGVIRWYWRLRELAEKLLTTPLRKKDSDVMILILLGLYQLGDLRIPHHASINETVKACDPLGKPWAKGLVNAILRGYLRKSEALQENLSDEARYSHPTWMIERIRQCWPQDWQAVLSANNDRPPMVLRVNRMRTDRTGYLQLLEDNGIAARLDPFSGDGIILSEPAPVAELPGFGDGHIAVQDTAAQWAAPALPVSGAARILDACAAPGGKLTHLLEAYPDAKEIVAIEIDEMRMQLIGQNLRRLGGVATVKVADVADLNDWWDGDPFDCVLIDAPCSATGIIRRRPDVKHHRRPGDLAKLVEQQAVILDRLWQTLRPDGYMLYVTCSILEEENEKQVGRFVSARSDLRTCKLDLPAGVAGQFGVQTLPGVHEMDGFYYALMQKAGG